MLFLPIAPAVRKKATSAIQWCGRCTSRRKDKEKAMTKSFNLFVAALALLGLLTAGSYSRKAQAQPPQQYPIMDKVADKIVQKYQTSTCEQLWLKKNEKAPPSAEEQKVIAFLKNDPQMRAAFISKIAAPIANKMFECGMIP
jgi:hypothetical protein